MRIPGWIGNTLIAIGVACLVIVAVGLVQAAQFQETATQAFERERSGPPPGRPSHDDLVGRLEVPRLHLSVMVIEGDDDATLARAAGHLPDTALPWETGNAVIAGHRDTFFRPLKNVRAGDEIRVTTARGTFDYHVTSTEIVAPSDVSVLAPSPTPSLTLVTCYPFVYVGRAPRRFIIHAR